MGKRPPSIVATDLKREANKYQEAHAKASESNQTLHKAMTLHISNLKVLSLPLDELQKHIPTVTVLDCKYSQRILTYNVVDCCS
jgi:tyrosine-protein phosphatase non-receptor type 23